MQHRPTFAQAVLNSGSAARPAHRVRVSMLGIMDEQAKKTALRRIPYGLYLLTAKNGDDIASGTVNWVTQTSFKPPMVAVGIKQDSHPYGVVKASGAFALNALGEDQKDIAQHSSAP